MKRFASILLVVSLARTAAAQPDVPTTGAPPPPPTPTGGTTDNTAGEPAPPPIDDATRAIIREEVEKALAAERAKAAAPTGEKAPAPNADPLGDNDYLSGDQGFMDTRLDLTFVNENVLVKPGETIPSVPGWRFGVPNSLGTLFFDNYDTRYSGYETLSHVALYKNYRRDHMEVEGGLVLKINDLSALQSASGTAVIGLNPIAVTDDGSYVLLSYWRDPTHKDPHRISLTAFPVSADRFRLGYSYRLSWGGNDEYQRVIGTTNSSLPGVKVQFDGGDHYAFIGMKSAVVLNRSTNNNEARLGFLGGAGVDLADNLVRLELNGGYFNRGPNELQGVDDQDVQLFGASAQIAVHKGMPVTSSLDYKLYKNDPERIGRAFQPVVYKPGVSWLAMAEFTQLGQTLKDAEKTDSTKIQWGKAGDLNIRVMIDRVRLRADLSYRDLAFVLHSVPSIPTYTTFPMQYEVVPDFFGDIGIDKNWNDRYTLGVVLGVERPAAFTSPVGVPTEITGGLPTKSQTAVARNNGGSTIYSILPVDAKPKEQFAVKFTGRVDFGAVYAALVNVYYSYDSNMTVRDKSGPEDEAVFVFGELNQIGGDVTLQAKF